MSPVDPEGASGHLRNAQQMLYLLECGIAAQPTSADGRYRPENGGKDCADVLEAITVRAARAVGAHLATMNARGLQIHIADNIALEALERAEHEAVYCAKSFLTHRGQDGGPRRAFVLGCLSALNRRLTLALREVESL